MLLRKYKKRKKNIDLFLIFLIEFIWLFDIKLIYF